MERLKAKEKPPWHDDTKETRPAPPESRQQVPAQIPGVIQNERICSSESIRLNELLKWTPAVAKKEIDIEQENEDE